MINVDSITEGLVIDHIEAGKGMEIYKLLKLDRLDCPVAIIKNVKSVRSPQGKKDIIKIESNLDIDFDVLGYIDPTVTVNIIRNAVITEKRPLALPEKLTNVIKCKNPRCITGSESGIKHIFKLSDRNKATYRCAYCQQEHK